MPRRSVGAAMRRLEDPRLLRGQATFIEDLELPRQLHVAFVRSVHPHARLQALRLKAARDSEGVAAVVTAYDVGTRTIPTVVTHPALRPCAQPILANGVVRYVGDPIAAVAAESRALAVDA